MSLLLFSVCLLVFAGRAVADDPSEDLVFTRVARAIDLRSHLLKQDVSLTMENTGARPLSSFLYTVDNSLADSLAYMGAEVQVGKDAEDVQELQFTEEVIRNKPDVTVYRFELPTPLSAGDKVTVTVTSVFAHVVIPFPKEITQNDKQLVQVTVNAYIYLPYPSKTQSTTMLLPSSSIEAFTRVSPVSTNENEITYGPYTDVSPYSYTRIQLHYENNGPFVGVVSLERVIEVSHWGNIAVEEHYHVRHFGAVLKGSFSRYDYQRNPNSGPSSVKSYRTLLPAAAKDVYYRDEIGNISTSHLREAEDFVEVEFRPRFPLFGGWQTRHYIGYNVPSYENLYHSGSHYMLKMRFIDHVFDDQIIEKATIKIILPEGAKNFVLKAPYPVTQYPVHYYRTYLDTVGRPVVTATKTNLVEQHIMDFELYYDYELVLMLQEPLLVVVALYLFFLFIIVFVRMDFSITTDEALLAKQQASVLIEQLLQVHDRRSALVSRYGDTITAYKQSKDVKTFKNIKKNLDDKYRQFTEEVAALNKQLRDKDPEAHAKVADIQKKAGDMKSAVDETCLLAEKVVSDRMSKQQYVEQEKSAQNRISRFQSEMDALIQAL